MTCACSGCGEKLWIAHAGVSRLPLVKQSGSGGARLSLQPAFQAMTPDCPFAAPVIDATLCTMACSDLMEFFLSLSAPSVPALSGEYAATPLAKPAGLAALAGGLVVSKSLLLGQWVSQSFWTGGEGRGLGHNSYRHFGRLVHRLPMETLVAPSTYDGQPAFKLVYGARCRLIRQVDEIREVWPGVYLGIGTGGFTAAQRRIPRPFMLKGPIGPCVSSLGAQATRSLPPLRAASRAAVPRRARVCGAADWHQNE